MKRPTSGRAWAYVGAFLGGMVSIAANVSHSYVPPAHALAAWHPYTGAVFGAVFWPVALLVAIEILARNRWKRGARWVLVRWCGLVPVAVVAAVVSYRHMSGLLAFYGEDPLTARIGPLAVDGLMVMATGALIMTAQRQVPEREQVTEPASVAPVVTAPAVPVSAPVVNVGKSASQGLTPVSPAKDLVPGSPLAKPAASPEPATLASDPLPAPARRVNPPRQVANGNGKARRSGEQVRAQVAEIVASRGELPRSELATLLDMPLSSLRYHLDNGKTGDES